MISQIKGVVAIRAEYHGACEACEVSPEVGRPVSVTCATTIFHGVTLGKPWINHGQSLVVHKNLLLFMVIFQ